MRVIFAGTPEFAARALERIVDAGFDVPLVLTQPDRPAGRGRKVAQSAVRTLAAARGLPVYQPERLRSDEQQAPVIAVPADAMVVAAYGLILPQRVLDHPRHGCLNIHASLLPRWRGAAPIQRAILAGDAQTGVSIMQMDAGLDTGPVIAMHPVEITDIDTAGTLHDRLAAVGAEAIVDALCRLRDEGRIPATPQPHDGVTYAAKITAEEARIDWSSQSAAAIGRRVRAFNPAPGAFTTIAGAVLKVWSARPLPAGAGTLLPRPLPADIETSRAPGSVAATDAGARPMPPGTVAVVDGVPAVHCTDGLLALDEVQPAGSRRMTGAEWTRGRPDLAAIELGT